MKEAQEPIRITKHNESTNQGVDKLKDELEKLREKKREITFTINGLNTKVEKQNTLEENVQLDLQRSEQTKNQLHLEIRNQEQSGKELDARVRDLQEKNT